MKVPILIFAILFSLCTSIFAQNKKLEIIELRNRTIIELDSESTLKITLTDSDRTFLKGKYKIINDSTLAINDTLITLSSIQSIRFVTKKQVKEAKRNLVASGLLTIIGTGLIIGVANMQEQSLSYAITGQFVVLIGITCILASVGTALTATIPILIYPKYPIITKKGKKQFYKLQIVDSKE